MDTEIQHVHQITSSPKHSEVFRHQCDSVGTNRAGNPVAIALAISYSFSELSLHPLLVRLSPLPFYSDDIPPMPAGHSSLHFSHVGQRCLWITTESFHLRSPCSTSDPVFAHVYWTQLHTSIVVCQSSLPSLCLQ